MIDLKKTENIVVLGVFLGVTGLMAASLMAGAFLLTEKPIAAAKTARLSKYLEQVLPPFDSASGDEIIVRKSPGGMEIKFFPAFAKGEFVGAAGEGTTPEGYAGRITMLAGLRPDGSIRSVIVTAHGETPGLGAEVCERKEVKRIDTLFRRVKKTGLPANAVLDQFSGLTSSPEKWRLNKNGGELKYKTGATITSGAVSSLAWEIAETFRADRAAITAEIQKKHQRIKNCNK